MSDYRHGAIWLINFEPQIGTEIKKVRPGLIISRTEFNRQRQKRKLQFSHLLAILVNLEVQLEFLWLNLLLTD